MADQPVVWIINRHQWPRACLRAELIERGYDAVGFAELRHAITAFLRPSASKPNIIVLELFDVPLNYNELNALASWSIPTIVLRGAVDLNQEIVKRQKWSATMKRPFTLGDVADLVEKTVPLSRNISRLREGPALIVKE